MELTKLKEEVKVRYSLRWQAHAHTAVGVADQLGLPPLRNFPRRLRALSAHGGRGRLLWLLKRVVVPGDGDDA